MVAITRVLCQGDNAREHKITGLSTVCYDDFVIIL